MGKFRRLSAITLMAMSVGPSFAQPPLPTLSPPDFPHYADAKMWLHSCPSGEGIISAPAPIIQIITERCHENYRFGLGDFLLLVPKDGVTSSRMFLHEDGKMIEVEGKALNYYTFTPYKKECSGEFTLFFEPYDPDTEDWRNIQSVAERECVFLNSPADMPNLDDPRSGG